MSNIKTKELSQNNINSIVDKKVLIGLMSIFFYNFGVDKKLMKKEHSFKNTLLYTILFLVLSFAGVIALFVNIYTTNIVVSVLAILSIVASSLMLFIRGIIGIVRGISIIKLSKDEFIDQINNEYFLDGVKGDSGLSLTLKRQVIFYKNHIDMFALIFAALAMVVFTLAVYVYTPLNNLLVQPRWPWAQGPDDPAVPFTMIQFFAFLSSMLGALCLMNYRTSKKKLFAVGFYALSIIQLINDAYYVSEILRHLSGTVIYQGAAYTKMTWEYPTGAGVAFTIVHFVLLAISIIIFIFSPLIQKFTKRIKVGASRQDKDIEIGKDEVILEADNVKNEYGYNLDDIDDELYRKVIGDNYKEVVPSVEFEEVKAPEISKKQKVYNAFAVIGSKLGVVTFIVGILTLGYGWVLSLANIIISKIGEKSYSKKHIARKGFSLSVISLFVNIIIMIVATYIIIDILFIK